MRTSPGGDAGDRAADAADGFLINGSVNNGAASPFAQLAAFGNNRRGARSLYNGGLGVAARQLGAGTRGRFRSPASRRRSRSYNDVQFVGNFGGPLKIPARQRRGPNLFRRLSAHDGSQREHAVGADADRCSSARGDFSQTRDAFGRPVQIVDPLTGLPFAGNVIPRDPHQPAGGGAARLLPAAERRRRRPLQLSDADPRWRRSRTASRRGSRSQSQRPEPAVRDASPISERRPTSANVFGFVDATAVSGLDAADQLVAPLLAVLLAARRAISSRG